MCNWAQSNCGEFPHNQNPNCVSDHCGNSATSDPPNCVGYDKDGECGEGAWGFMVPGMPDNVDWWTPNTGGVATCNQVNGSCTIYVNGLMKVGEGRSRGLCTTPRDPVTHLPTGPSVAEYSWNGGGWNTPLSWVGWRWNYGVSCTQEILWQGTSHHYSQTTGTPCTWGVDAQYVLQAAGCAPPAGNLAVQVREVSVGTATCAQVVAGASVNGATVGVTGPGVFSQSSGVGSTTYTSVANGTYTALVSGVPTGFAAGGYIYCNQSTAAGAVSSGSSVTTTAGNTSALWVGVVRNPTISGSFFDASAMAGSSFCAPWLSRDETQRDASGLRLGGSLKISGSVGVGNSVVLSTTGGKFSRVVETSGAPVTYTLSDMTTGYQLRWLTSCQGGNSVTYPIVGASAATNPMIFDYGFWRIYGGWWQVRGGSIYSGGNITSTIPSSCNEAPCEPYLIRASANQTGVAIHKTGAITLGGATNANISQGGLSGQYTNANVQAVSGPDAGTGIYNYTYFVNKTTNYPKTVWVGTEKPTYSNPGGQGYEIYTRTGAATIDFSPTGTEKMIFLVNGNVTVAGDVTVPVGATLTVIANGVITFSGNVAQGQFVGNSLVISNGSNQFQGEGNFIGYTSISFGRSLTSPGNNTVPAELFTFRPDLIVNAPEALKTTTGVWREVTP